MSDPTDPNYASYEVAPSTSTDSTNADETVQMTRRQLEQLRNGIYAEARKTFSRQSGAPKIAEATPTNTPVAHAQDVASIVSATVKATLESLGRPDVAPQTRPPSPPPGYAQPTTNISDKGSAAPTAATDPDAIYETRPLDATSFDFDRLVTKHGHHRAHEIAARNINAYLRTVRLVPDNSAAGKRRR